METLINYLKQPTTWAGLVAIATSLGVSISPALSAEIASAGAAVAGLLLVVFNENKDK